jgi:predicted nucleotidyltransferase component of viral defense system
LADSKLSTFQKEFLDAFFRHEDRFFLTGGAALAGFHLGHRSTHDLDLFTLSDALDQGFAVASEIVRQMSASLESIETSPDFRRFLVGRGTETVLVDLVRERVPQIVSEKPIILGIRVDPPEEILANKLCALLSRSEIRDLVDVRALEMAGYPMEDALPAAHTKDTGLTPAQLGWVLSQIKLGDDLLPPGGVSKQALQEYLADLVARLARLAFPG